MDALPYIRKFFLALKVAYREGEFRSIQVRSQELFWLLTPDLCILELLSVLAQVGSC
jgi:hypothetical protein